MKLIDEAKKLLELEKRATKGPWHNDGYRIYGPTEDQDKRNGHCLTEYKYSNATPWDGELIVNSRNLLSLILENYLEVVEELNNIKFESEMYALEELVEKDGEDN